MIAFHMLPSWWWMLLLPVTWWVSYKFGRAAQEIDDDDWFTNAVITDKYMPIIENKVHEAYQAGLTQGQAHAAHDFAQAIPEIKSKAWDEGFNAGYEEALEDN